MDADDNYEERLYDEFPAGADAPFPGPYGPDQGFNTWVRINDESLFTDEAKAQPAIREFLDAPFSVNYVQFKSSHKEAEWFLHKPHRAMAEGGVQGIVGSVAGFPANPRIATLVINHERTLAKFITRALVIEDGAQAGQMIHKQDDGSL
jgi:hypothetical protein